MVVTSLSKRIYFLSCHVPGTVHDLTLLKNNFKPCEEDKKARWFEKYQPTVDCGYIGIENDYEISALNIPYKKPKKSELTPGQKKHNRQVSQKRIFVEHSIGGMKRYRILKDKLRTHRADLYDNFLGVCAGLWNFYLEVSY